MSRRPRKQKPVPETPAPAPADAPPAEVDTSWMRIREVNVAFAELLDEEDAVRRALAAGEFERVGQLLRHATHSNSTASLAEAALFLDLCKAYTEARAREILTELLTSFDMAILVREHIDAVLEEAAY
jgi:hypothetical protein